MTTSAPPQGWTVNDATFAARLALVRMRMGWNVKEAARECGQAPATWRMWEIDGILPRHHVQVAKQISDRSGCDYLWLLLGPDRGEGGGTLRFARDPLAERLVAVATDPANRPASRRTRPVTRPVRPLVTAVAA